MSKVFFALALAAAAVACRASTTSSPASAQSGAYVITLGNDTIAVDQFTRTGNRFEGTLLQRAPRVTITRYVVTLDSSGDPSLLELTTRLPDGTMPPNAARGASVSFTRDSAISRIQRDTLVTVRVGVRHAFPFIGNAYSLYSLPIAALRASGQDSAAFFIAPAGSRNPTPLGVVRKGPNRYWAYLGPFPFELTIDDRGQILTIDGAQTTQHVLSTRQEPMDLTTLAASWAARERQTAQMGTLSPRDTVNATIGAAQLWVDYGRPSTRGRAVFASNGVLGDTIWRTGANAATQFRTSVPLTIGGQSVPAGTYTLWTLAIPTRYQLIINKQTRQWGTEYNPAQDLTRVPLAATSISPPVDRFTIAIETTGANSGVLKMRWATTELSVPFTTP